MPKHPTGSFEAGFSIWSKMFRQCSDSRATLNVIVNEAADFVARGCSKQLVVDEVTERAVIGHGMDADVVQRALAEALERPPRSNGKANGRHTPEAKARGKLSLRRPAARPVLNFNSTDFRTSSRKRSPGFGPVASRAGNSLSWPVILGWASPKLESTSAPASRKQVIGQIAALRLPGV